MLPCQPAKHKDVLSDSLPRRLSTLKLKLKKSSLFFLLFLLLHFFSFFFVCSSLPLMSPFLRFLTPYFLSLSLPLHASVSYFRLLFHFLTPHVLFLSPSVSPFPSHLAGVALKIKASQTLIDWRLSGLPRWATESEKEKSEVRGDRGGENGGRREVGSCKGGDG